MTTPQIVQAAIIGGVCLLFAIPFVMSLPLWLKGRAAGVPVTLLELVGMRLRRARAGAIVRGAIRLNKAGIPRPLASIETHDLAGGSVASMVDAMIAAREAGLNLAWNTAAAIDLAGQDVADLVRRASKPEQVVWPAPHGWCEAALADRTIVRFRLVAVVRLSLDRVMGSMPLEPWMAHIERAFASAFAQCGSVADARRRSKRIAEALAAPGVLPPSAFDLESLQVSIA